jgi:hypothetical protein
MKKPVIWVLAAMVLLAMVGCAGTMDGLIRQDAERIQITFTDSRIASAELITVLPDGERFQGKPEKLDAQKDMMAAGAAQGTAGPASFPALQSFPGNVKALLSGSKGRQMACRFRLTDLVLGFASGGFGLCQLSDGRVIDVFF